MNEEAITLCGLSGLGADGCSSVEFKIRSEHESFLSFFILRQ